MMTQMPMPMQQPFGMGQGSAGMQQVPFQPAAPMVQQPQQQHAQMQMPQQQQLGPSPTSFQQNPGSMPMQHQMGSIGGVGGMGGVGGVGGVGIGMGPDPTMTAELNRLQELLAKEVRRAETAEAQLDGERKAAKEAAEELESAKAEAAAKARSASCARYLSSPIFPPPRRRAPPSFVLR